MKYHIAAVARMTDLSVDTIRAWERRYSIVSPDRDSAGLRLYDDADVARLKLARIATQMGHPIRKVALLSQQELEQLAGEGLPRSSTDYEAVVERILAALDNGDADQAEQLLRSAALLLPVKMLILDVVAPVLRAVGDRWQQGRLSVWQEHLTSTLVRNAAGTLANGSRTREAMLFATPPFELHEFGIALASILASAHGHVTYNLGPALPAHEVAAAVSRLHAEVVVIGITQHSFPVEDVLEYARALDRSLAPSVKLWLGGTLGERIAPLLDSPRVRGVESLEEFDRIA